MYVPFDVGRPLYCGRLPETPKDNPIRRVYVDIKKQYPYPSWGQMRSIMRFAAIRVYGGK